MIRLIWKLFFMLKKIKIVLSTLCLGLLVGCSSTVSWENNINKDIILLKNNGFHAYISNSKEDLQEFNEGINKEIKQEGYNFTVKFVNVYSMTETLDLTSGYYITFGELSTKEEAKNYFTFLNRENRMYKIYISETIVIYTTSIKATELLNYKFK